jgi:hypothetical protein
VGVFHSEHKGIMYLERLWAGSNLLMQKIIAGRIANILVPEGSAQDSGAVIVIEHFGISDLNDERLQMPLLIRTAENYAVEPKVP